MHSHNRSEVLDALCLRAKAYYAQENLPFVTLTYAQSLDGSIAGVHGQPMVISCRESLVYTHALRARHDGILVGINTVLSDDPVLSTRYVDGQSPRPIVLDSKLRIPVDARIIAENPELIPIVFTTAQGSLEKKEALKARNVSVFTMPEDSKGWIDIKHVLPRLGEMGICNLMVEGGAKVITSFMQAQCVDHLIVTLSMKMIGGTPVLDTLLKKNGNGQVHPVDINPSSVHWEGVDMILHGDPVWEE